MRSFLFSSFLDICDEIPQYLIVVNPSRVLGIGLQQIMQLRCLSTTTPSRLAKPTSVVRPATCKPATLSLPFRCAIKCHAQQHSSSASSSKNTRLAVEWQPLLTTTAGLYLLQQLPAAAEALDGSPGYSQGSYIVSLGLFLVTLPGVF